MAELILAVDAGTTSVRAAVVGSHGAFLGRAVEPLVSLSPGPGRVEQDAEAVWAATRRVIAGALADAGRAADDLAAIGLTTQRASAVVWDRRSGAPLSPLVIWSDLRGAARAGELQAAGFPLAPQQSATKLESILAEVDAPSDRVAWGSLDSFLIFRLTGGAAHVTDRSQAWPTGYLGLPDLGWNTALIAHQGLDPASFPTLVDSWGELAIADPEVLGAAVPVACDLADQQSALLAHGEAPATAKITFGTAAAFDLATGADFLFPAPHTPPLIVSSVAGETRFCVEGMVIAAGRALDWLREAFCLGSPTEFDALAARAESSGGAAFLPALQGLGAPHGDPGRRGGLVGLSPETGRAELARAALEGVAFRAREIVETIYGATSFSPPDVLAVDGGLTRSGLFLQVLADALGRPVRRHAAVEATLMGAAMAAGCGAGLGADSDRAQMIRYEPQVALRLSADESRARFEAWKRAVYA